jgi:hypothetical protein
MGILKIISGGQTGVDRLGLEIAKSIGIETGGTAPKGFLTENGNDISLRDLGLVEHPQRLYPPRTKSNVSDSDGTIYFASDTKSRGLKLTIKICKDMNKPYLINPTIDRLTKWLIDNDIQVLNIAGNRGSKLKDDFKVQIEKTLLQSLALYNSHTK